MKEFSKGMRKHRRKEKALKRKKVFTKPSSQVSIPSIPKVNAEMTLRSFYDVPFSKKGTREGNLTEYCPNCRAVPYKDVTWVRFKEGPKQVHMCYNCGTLYRSHDLE